MPQRGICASAVYGGGILQAGDKDMGIRKYASDYRLEEHVLPNGKSQTTRIYQGPHFRFVAPEEEVAQLRRKILLASALVIVGLIPLFLNNTQIGRTFYVMIPMAFTLLPWYYALLAGWRIGKVVQPLIREEKDSTDVRLHRTCPWLLGLVGATFAGSLVYWVLKGLQEGEWLCLCGVAVSLAAAIYLFTLRKKAKTKEIKS